MGERPSSKTEGRVWVGQSGVATLRTDEVASAAALFDPDGNCRTVGVDVVRHNPERMRGVHR